MSLIEEINRFTEDAAKRLPQEFIPTFRNLIGRLVAEKLGRDAPGTSQDFPDFVLKDHDGKDVQASRFWNEYNLVLKFYRGGWCPYCHLELTALQRHTSELAATGSAVFAIAPEKPSFQEVTKTKTGADFKFLWDENNALARKLGIAFPVDDAVRDVYLKLNLDLDDVNGEWVLPIPATFVVSKGAVKYRHIDVDYMRRQDPVELLEELRKLEIPNAANPG